MCMLIYLRIYVFIIACVSSDLCLCMHTHTHTFLSWNIFLFWSKSVLMNLNIIYTHTCYAKLSKYLPHVSLLNTMLLFTQWADFGLALQLCPVLLWYKITAFSLSYSVCSFEDYSIQIISIINFEILIRGLTITQMLLLRLKFMHNSRLSLQWSKVKLF